MEIAMTLQYMNSVAINIFEDVISLEIGFDRLSK